MNANALNYSYKGAPTYASGFTGAASTVVFACGKIGYLNINAVKKTSSGTGSSWVTCFTLPSSIKAAYLTLFTVANDANMTDIFEFRILTNGNVQWYDPPSGVNAWGGTAFLID